MVEQRRLAGPRFAPKNEHPALARPHGREQVVYDLALASPSAQHGGHASPSVGTSCSPLRMRRSSASAEVPERVLAAAVALLRGTHCGNAASKPGLLIPLLPPRP